MCGAILCLVAGCSGDGQDGDSATTITEESTPTVGDRATTTVVTPVGTTPEPEAPAATTASPTASEVSVSTSTSVAADTSPALAISRPYVDPAGCTPLATKEWEAHDLMLRPFAAHSESPIVMQVIANPVTGPKGPLALLLRYRDRPRPTDTNEAVQINDWQVQLLMVPNGNAEARWDLADGGQAYLRVRDLDRDTIVALIGGLVPRPSDTAMPGFDLDRSTGAQLGLASLHEDTNMSLNGRGSWFACQDPHTQIIYRVQTLAGDPLLQYTGIVDRPRPVDVGMVDDTIIVVSGAPWMPEGLFSADEVTNTDEATWNALLTEPFP